MPKDSSYKKFGNRLNLRDFSLYVNEDGYVLKPDLFYRSRCLCKLYEDEVDYFKRHHLETIIDLRGEDEAETSPDTSIPGASILRFPLFPIHMKAINAVEESHKEKHHHRHPPRLRHLYGQLVSDEASIQGLKQVLHFIFEEEHHGAILWHCSEGKDRVGIVSALFLSALGYPRSIIFDDYLFTNVTNEKKARHLSFTSFLKWHSITLSKEYYAAFIADRSYLEEAFLAIESRYGSVSNYLYEALELDPTSIEAFKEKYMIKQ